MEGKKQREEVKRLFVSNWGLKLISLLIAFGLWFTVVYIKDPLEEETFVNIPVQFENTDILTDQGLVYEVLEGSDVVKRVNVIGPKTVLSSMRSEGRDSIIAVANFANKNMADVIEIEFRAVTQYSNSITSIEAASGSEYLKLFVENADSKNIPVRIETKGEVAQSYQLGSAKAEQNRITISGGVSKVEKVSYAAVTVDVTGSSSDIATSEVIHLYDKDGNLLSNDLVEMSAVRTMANVTVLATKTVPVIYRTSGELPEGYQMIGNIRSDVEQVTLAGSEQVLNGVNSIVVSGEALNLSGLTEDYTAEISLRSFLPGGVQFAKTEENTTAVISIDIEQEMERNLKLLSGNVSVINIPEGIMIETAEEHEIYDILVTGLENDVNQVVENNLTAVLDLGSWIENWIEENEAQQPEGTFYIEAEVELPDGVTIVEPLEVRITFLQ